LDHLRESLLFINSAHPVRTGHTVIITRAFTAMSDIRARRSPRREELVAKQRPPH
jgi:hypothetical protein